MLSLALSDDIFWVYFVIISLILLVGVIWLYKHKVKQLYVHVIFAVITLHCLTLLVYQAYVTLKTHWALNWILGIFLFSVLVWNFTLNQSQLYPYLYLGLSVIAGFILGLYLYFNVGMIAALLLPYFVWLAYAALTSGPKANQ